MVRPKTLAGSPGSTQISRSHSSVGGAELAQSYMLLLRAMQVARPVIHVCVYHCTLYQVLCRHHSSYSKRMKCPSVWFLHGCWAAAGRPAGIPLPRCPHHCVAPLTVSSKRGCSAHKGNSTAQKSQCTTSSLQRSIAMSSTAHTCPYISVGTR